MLDFETRFVRTSMVLAGVIACVLSPFFYAIDEADEILGLALGLFASIVGYTMDRTGYREASVQVFLVLFALAAWVTAAIEPNEESVLAIATAYSLLSAVAAIAVGSRFLTGLFVFCWLGVVLLIVRVASLGINDGFTPGNGVALTFVPFGFALQGLVTRQYHAIIRRLEDAEREARQALTARERFFANVSHELRTPLNAILGYSEMLLEVHEGDAETHGDLQRIHRSGDQLLTHINALLDLSKLASGHQDRFVEQVDLNRVAVEVADTLAPLIAERGNTMDLDLEEDLVLGTDLVKVRQILTNLLNNANKFTDAGSLVLRTRRNKGGAILEICDTGIGIAEDVVPKLFEPFTQADISTTRQFGGTGLGLAIVKEFAELLDGNVTVESTLGEGSVFRVTLTDLG